ncbi:glutamate racemase [Robbsia andropogonis]|uniref:glutamate racemase n=1 Tax=Robbsia andropogonis TaxID=28092 RepID=UPI003F4F4CEA
MLHDINRARPSPMPATGDATAPVGVFDSGVGGLSVVRAIRQVLPDERVLYCADARYNPYGDRSEAFVIDRTLAIGEWLLAQGVKAVVVACNTATTIAVSALRDALPIPVVGVEPGVKPAVAASRSGVAGVLATAGTLRSTSFQRLVLEHAGGARLICTAGHGLVEAIESRDLASSALRARLMDYLLPMLDAGADTLALGCTHYPFLTPLIDELTEGRLHIIDNGTPVALQLARRLDAHGLRARPSHGAVTSAATHVDSDDDGVYLAPATAPLILCCTGDTTTLDWLARQACGENLSSAATVDIRSPLTAAERPFLSLHSAPATVRSL